MSGLLIGVAGLSALDHVFGSATLALGATAAHIDCGGRRFVSPLVKPPGQERKPVAWVPDELLERADSVQPGGGALTACLMLRSICPEAVVRYVDAGERDECVQAALEGAAIEYRPIGLHAVPRNAVFGSRAAGNRLVIKSPLGGASGAPGDLGAAIRWLLECDVVLADSVKDTILMTRLTSAAARGGLHLYAMLTPSLSRGYVLDAVVPWASVVVAGIREAGDLLGFQVGTSPEEAVAALRALTECAQFAPVYLTLGQDGLLVADLETMSVYHVCLRRAVAAEVRAELATQRAAVCGCGDAAAAGVLAFLESGRSLLAGPAPGLPRAAGAALAGSAAALRRLGFSRALSPRDFAVHEIDRSGFWGWGSAGAA